MKKLLLLFNGLLLSLFATSQDVSKDLQKKADINPTIKETQWNALPDEVQVSFGSSNKRYSQDIVPMIGKSNSQVLTAWKGEKVHTQLVVWSKSDVANMSVKISSLLS